MGWGGGGAVASPLLFPNITLKQLRFKTLVLKFPGDACKMPYFLSVAPHSTRNSAPPSQLCLRFFEKNRSNSVDSVSVTDLAKETQNNCAYHSLSQFNPFFNTEIWIKISPN